MRPALRYRSTRQLGTKPASGMRRSHRPESSVKASHANTSNSVVRSRSISPATAASPAAGTAAAPLDCGGDGAGDMGEGAGARGGGGGGSSRMKTWICGSTGSKSGAAVTCSCSCCVSTQWYVLQRSTHLQLMQMQLRGGAHRAPPKTPAAAGLAATAREAGEAMILICVYAPKPPKAKRSLSHFHHTIELVHSALTHTPE
mmetsp:Transcript_34959/g.111681  ORF Transcript_34959/g.111681 Transcript_34959/m.111681 type:complete len:201 (+) Transcript_34959:94-696(+)